MEDRVHGGAAGKEERAEEQCEGKRTGELVHNEAVVRVWFETDVGRMLLTIMRRRATYRKRAVGRHS